MAARAVEKASDVLYPGMPRIGFGCGDLWGGASQATSAKLVEAALDAGIRYFDVARLYGDGSAESVLGSILPRIRDRVVIASKAGILPWSMLLWPRILSKATRVARRGGPLVRTLVPPPPPAAARHGAFRLRDLTQSVNRSLNALRTDYLDILLLHECSLAHARSAETLDFLERLRAQGKIRAFGIATHLGETVQILNEEPAIAPVAQFPSDALNRNLTRIPPGKAELLVTHSSLKFALPRLIDHLAADRAAGVRWEKATGIAPDDRTQIAGLLLAEAAAQNESGVVLFSSSRPERIGQAVAAIEDYAPRLPALRQELASLELRDPVAP